MKPAIDIQDEGRYLAVRPALEEFFKSMNKRNPEQEAQEEIIFRALEICDNDPQLLDSNGLPIDKFQFKLLEARLSRFLSFVGFQNNQYESHETDPDHLTQIRGQINDKVNRKESDRGAIQEVFDSNDQIIGQYIAQIEDAFARAGTSSENLLNKNCRLESGQHIAILQACFSVARDMILIIGPEKYDEVRFKIDRRLFHEYCAEEIIKTPSLTLAQNERSKNPKGFWNSLPRVWIEELMILARNPEIVQQICDFQGSSCKKSVRKHISAFNKQIEGPKKPKNKMTQSEYFIRNVKLSDFKDPDYAFAILERGQHIRLPLIKYSRNFTQGDIEEMEKYVGQIFSGFDEKRALYAIRNFCGVLSIIDEAFRECFVGAVQKTSTLVKASTLGSARLALKKSSINNNESIRRYEPPFTFVVKADCAGSDEERLLLDVFANNPPSVIFRQLEIGDVDKVFNEAEEFRSKINMVMSMFEEMEARIDEAKNLKQLYDDYAVIKYCILIYKKLYGDNAS